MCVMRLMENSLSTNKESIRMKIWAKRKCAKFVPHTLTPEKKAKSAMRSAHCRYFLKTIMTAGLWWYEAPESNSRPWTCEACTIP
ncbi:hypothetical protein TNCV_3515921 [Trichonephila clavipes]|nr:hypothetical protein TNCV_3515921 [Trichonephila clavipes]